LVVFAPFGLTVFVLIKLVTFGKESMIKPMVSLLQWLRDNYFTESLERFYTIEGDLLWWIDYTLLFISITLVIFFLYLIGVLSATFFGRRYINLGEKILHQVPGARFLYNTIKQLGEILSRPKSNAFQKVVLVEFPKSGVWGLAFFTGTTIIPKTREVRLNVFLPTIPNPTTGFLMLMKPEEVMLTNLSISDASRFVFSFGVVEIENLIVGPFPPSEYLKSDAAAAPRTPAEIEGRPWKSFLNLFKNNKNDETDDSGKKGVS
jgi:uncharacterized membrane protein